MARAVKTFSMTSLPDALFGEIHSYLMSEGYEYTNYQNEQVFKKGKGLMTGPSFIKVSFQNNTLQLEAWMKFALLPGVYLGEMGLTGALGAAVKGPLRKRVEHIVSLIQRYGGVPAAAPAGYTPAMPTNPGANKFCTNCGAALAPGAAFCTHCGKAV